jgi:MarR family 2-MHQ and catechol resistance regulon transcriptional repressor
VYLSSGSITTAVGRLERRKLVVRSAWKGDKRIVLVALTNRGRDLERAMSSFRDPNLEVPLAALRPAERKTLADLLSRLCATTEKLASPPLSPSPWGRPTRYP